MHSRQVLLATSILLAFSLALGEEKDHQRPRYANRPDRLMPYGKTRVYKEIFTQPMEFKGAGRDYTDPTVDTVKIGLIAPLTAEDGAIIPKGFRAGVDEGAKAAFGKHLLHGAVLALEEANADGGYRGIPFELVRRTDLLQWGQASDELVKFTFEDKVWAVITGIDSNHCHVLNRVTLKTQVPLVNAGTTDPTLTEHNIPWLVRCMSDDRLNSYELLNYINRVRKFSRIAVLRVNDRDGRVGVEEFIKGARRLGTPVLLELRFRNGDQDFREQLQTIRALDPEVIVLWGNPPEAARIVRQAHELGMRQQFVGFDRLAQPMFIHEAGKDAEGMVLATTCNLASSDPVWTAFKENYRKRFSENPDTFSAHGYDAMRLIIQATREAGLNRARIRDALYSIREFPGASGTIHFDSTLNNVERPWLTEVTNGELRYFQPADWDRSAYFPVQLKSEETGR